MAARQLMILCCSGGLDVAQLGLLLKELGHPMETNAVQKVFNEYDLDHSGKIEFSEFLRYGTFVTPLPTYRHMMSCHLPLCTIFG